MVTAIFLIYISIGFIFHETTRPEVRPKFLIYYISYIIDLFLWPIVILIFEYKKWKN